MTRELRWIRRSLGERGQPAPTVGIIRDARYPLLQRLDLVEEGRLDHVHSVLVQPAIDFTIYLPPRRLVV